MNKEFWVGVIVIITSNFYRFLLCQIVHIYILCPLANTNRSRVIPRVEKLLFYGKQLSLLCEKPKGRDQNEKIFGCL